MNLNPGVSPRLLAGSEISPRVWLQGPGPRAGVRSLVDRSLVLDTVAYVVHGVLKLVLAY